MPMRVSSLRRRVDPNPNPALPQALSLALTRILTLTPTPTLTRTQREACERGWGRQVRRVGGGRVAEDGRRGALAAAAVRADRLPAKHLVPHAPPA